MEQNNLTELTSRLHYLEKDWEWASVFLEALSKGELSVDHIQILSSLIENAIVKTKSQKQKKLLGVIQDQLRTISSMEGSTRIQDKEESIHLLDSI